MEPVAAKDMPGVPKENAPLTGLPPEDPNPAKSCPDRGPKLLPWVEPRFVVDEEEPAGGPANGIGATATEVRSGVNAKPDPAVEETAWMVLLAKSVSGLASRDAARISSQGPPTAPAKVSILPGASRSSICCGPRNGRRRRPVRTPPSRLGRQRMGFHHDEKRSGKQRVKNFTVWTPAS